MESLKALIEEEKPVSRRTFALLLSLITLGALALRLYRIGAEELWLDETISAVAAMAPARDILAGAFSPKNPPLYYLILHYWSLLFGIGETALRSFSAVVGTLLVVGIGSSGARFFSRRAGLLAAAVAAAAPLSVHYSQETRCYILLAAAALAYIHFSLALADGPTVGRQIGFVISGLALAYTHAAGILLLPLPNLLFLARPARKYYLRLLALQLLIAAGAAPYWIFVARSVEVELAGWVSRMWLEMAPGAAFLGTFESLGAGGAYSKLIFRLWQPPNPVLVVMNLLLFVPVIVLGASLRPGAESPPSRRLAGIGAAAAFAIPLAAAYLISAVWQPIYLVGRTDFIAAPAFCLLAGAGLSRLKPQLMVCLMMVFLFLAGHDLINFYSRPPFNSNRSMAAYVIKNTTPEDPVVCAGETFTPFIYYEVRNREEIRLSITYPSWSLMERKSHDPEKLLREPAVLEKQAANVAAWLTKRTRAGGSVWVVAGARRYQPVNAFLFEAMSRGFDFAGTGNAENGIPVYRFVKKKDRK